MRFGDMRAAAGHWGIGNCRSTSILHKDALGDWVHARFLYQFGNSNSMSKCFYLRFGLSGYKAAFMIGSFHGSGNILALQAPWSSRDSFITHRAFCDALAQENARLPPGMNAIGGHLYANRSINLGLPPMSSQLPSLQDQPHPSTDLLRLRGAGGSGAAQFNHLNPTAFRPTQPPSFFLGGGGGGFNEDPQLLQGKQSFHGMMQLQDLQTNPNPAPSSAAAAAAAANLFNLGFFSNSGGTSGINNESNGTGSQGGGHLLGPDQFGSAGGGTERMRLLAGNLMSNQIDTNMSSLYHPSMQTESIVSSMSATALLQKAAQMGATSSGGGGGSLLRNVDVAYSGGTHVENENHFQDMLMNTFANSNNGVFNEEVAAGFGSFNPALTSMDEGKFHRNLSAAGGNITRDFLGVGSMIRGMPGGVLQREQHLGMEMSSMDAEMKASNHSFGGGRLQQ